ncbi:MAG: sulfatase [Planctomycetes bacterium]|nr:sulfatase [Planctomycetota bacterium]
MPRPRIVVLVVLLSACLSPCGCRRGVAPEEQPIDPALLPMKYPGHNVILVSFDALQAAHVGCLGYARNTSPTLDAVARQAFNFTHAYSVASWTVPASMSWFTGVYPSEHGLTNKFAVYTPELRKLANLKQLAPSLMTLADILKHHGYVTGGFTGNAGVSGGFGYEQGFDVYFHELEKFGGLEQSVPEALKWIAANKDNKFFVFLHGYDVHGQYAPAAGYDYRFVDKGYDFKYTGAEHEQEALREEGLDKGRLTMRPEDVRFWRAIYDEKIRRADDRFAQFLAKLEAIGVAGKTLLVLTSDHGTEFYEHGRFDHGFTLYNEPLHVPLIIKLPGQKAGKTVADRVSSIDIMPTILDLLDVPLADAARKQLRGTSLAAALQGKAVTRDVFSETDYRQYTYKRSIITPDGWKLIYTLETRTRELYDLNADPAEEKNLAGADVKRADALESKLFAHFRSIGHDLGRKRWEVGFNPVYTFPRKDKGK